MSPVETTRKTMNAPRAAENALTKKAHINSQRIQVERCDVFMRPNV
jgi:hypothetical protein